MPIVKINIPSTDKRLGRHIHHDSRSLNYKFDTRFKTIMSVVHARHIPILDQGSIGSCTANAGIGALGTDPLFSVLPATPKYSLDENGAVKLYSNEEVMDGNGTYPPNDDGSSGLTCAKVLQAAGLISGYQHTFTLNDALLALSTYPILIGINWYNSMFTPAADGGITVDQSSGLAGGHELLVRENDAVNQRIWVDNSWGAWGVSGRAYLSWADFGTLLSLQGDVTVLLPLSVAPPTPTPPTPTPTPTPPTPTPTPPTPTPTPTPAHDPNDVKLVAEFEAWRKQVKSPRSTNDTRMIAEFEAWRKIKGL